ncbi:GNAT family N-acetyltransferase [Kitasatospora arboriphila]
MVDLCTGILSGTLDAHSRDDLARMTAREAAQFQYDEEFAHYATPRAWWRVAESAGTGEPVGLVIAARNAYRPIVAYLGVLPAHRGRGLAEELLAEGTRVLAEAERRHGPGLHRRRQHADGGRLRPGRVHRVRARVRDGLGLTSSRRGRGRPARTGCGWRRLRCRS